MWCSVGNWISGRRRWSAGAIKLKTNGDGDECHDAVVVDLISFLWCVCSFNSTVCDFLFLFFLFGQYFPVSNSTWHYSHTETK